MTSLNRTDTTRNFLSDAQIAKQGMIETGRLAGYATFGQCNRPSARPGQSPATQSFATGVSKSSSGRSANRC